MWKELKISEQTYFIYCDFEENTRDITFMLYDFKIIWCQSVAFEDAKHKVKLLNKRFDFNEDNVKEALLSNAIQSAVLGEDPNSENCSLKLKYRVKNCLLSYEWCLKKQNLLEFQQTIVQPLLLTLLDCRQQIDILANTVRKKDIELKQYRIEGAILNRKTLATKPFDFDDFNTKFESCDKTTQNFIDLAKYMKESENYAGPELLNEKLNHKITDSNVKPDGKLEADQRTIIKMSPRQKKRKANEVKMEHLQQHLKLFKKGLEYESSQSQTPSCGSSQNTEESKTKNFNSSDAKEPAKSAGETPLSARKSVRCSTLKQKQNKMSSDDKTDSDYEDNLRTSRQKSARKSLDSRKLASSTNSNQITKTNSKNVSPQEKGAAELRSRSLLNRTRKEDLSEGIGSKVFDFLSESDDDIPLLKSYNSEKQISEQNFQNLRNNTSTPLNKSSIFDSGNSPSLNNSLSHPSTPIVIREISSQLDNIKKELETLEAMRLADLQQRVCKV